MTGLHEMLGHGARLRRQAFEHTRDTNEAWLLVHGVMADAVRKGSGWPQDLELTLSRIIARRVSRKASPLVKS